MKILKLIFILYLHGGLLMNICCGQVQNNAAQVIMPGPAIGVAWGFTYGYGNRAEIFMPQLKKMGVNLTKLYLFWQQVEPVKDSFQWDAVDTFLKQLKPTDEALIAVFSSSLWATKTASQQLPPSPAQSPDQYYSFIFNLVKHCKGKIKLWQNDSEANNPVYWKGNNEEFVDVLKIFYRAVKNADPMAKVVMGGYDGLFNPPGMPEIPGQQYGLSFFSKAIKEGRDYFDIFDIRLYANPYTIPARVDFFRKLLDDSGRNQPVICTEYNGPGFFGFPVNFKYIGQVTAMQKAVVGGDTAAYMQTRNPIANMYDSISTLAPQTQMFMVGCSKELDDKYQRLQCRDIVMRNVLAFSAGVQKTMYWDLTHNTDDKNNLMTLMFGKNKLIEFENEAIKEYPVGASFTRMAKYLTGIHTIRKMDIAGTPLLYLFEIAKGDKSIVYVAWEKRDPFTGENLPPTHYIIPWLSAGAKATDIFGNTISMVVSNNNLDIDISGTPIFIEISKIGAGVISNFYIKLM